MSEMASPVVTQPSTESIYNRMFWLSYAANVSLVTANALTFRFAEFVRYLGGTEQLTGTIVSVGILGALLVRLRLGQEIDRYGTRRIWMASSVLFIVGCAMFLLTNQISWVIYVGRTFFALGLAGMFTCSVVYIQNQVPAHRRTEVIGNLGSSGFVGMIAGSILGDLILNSMPPGQARFLALFGGAAVLGVFYLSIIVHLTRRDVHRRPQETPPIHRLLLRYWPGSVLLVAIMMGVGFAATTVFLTRFATYRGLHGIGMFFTGYAVSAFCFRVAAQNWSRTIGRHRMILLGLAGHWVGYMILPWITRDWHLLFPAVACGFGHALLFPAVVSLGAGAFPAEYRGSGTTIILGFTEIGVLASAPALGWMIDHFGFTAMFLSTGFMSLGVAFLYAVTAARQPDAEAAPQPVVTSESMCGDFEATDEDHDDESLLAEHEFGLDAPHATAVPVPQMGRSG
jgi:MFS family permease